MIFGARLLEKLINLLISGTMSMFSRCYVLYLYGHCTLYLPRNFYQCWQEQSTGKSHNWVLGFYNSGISITTPWKAPLGCGELFRPRLSPRTMYNTKLQKRKRKHTEISSSCWVLWQVYVIQLIVMQIALIWGKIWWWSTAVQRPRLYLWIYLVRKKFDCRCSR